LRETLLKKQAMYVAMVRAAHFGQKLNDISVGAF